VSPPLPPSRLYPTSSDAAASLAETVSARGYAPITTPRYELHPATMARMANSST